MRLIAGKYGSYVAQECFSDCEVLLATSDSTTFQFIKHSLRQVQRYCADHV